MSHSSDYIDRSNYYGDSRVRARERRDDSPIKSIDEKKMEATVVLEDDDGNEEEFEVPVSYEVCPTCDGKGSHVNPSVDAGGISAADLYEDHDFAEMYMDGAYDVTCYECGGKRVVAEIDREHTDPAVLKRIDAKAEADAQYRREVDAERRMGY